MPIQYIVSPEQAKLKRLREEVLDIARNWMGCDCLPEPLEQALERYFKFKSEAAQ